MATGARARGGSLRVPLTDDTLVLGGTLVEPGPAIERHEAGVANGQGTLAATAAARMGTRAIALAGLIVVIGVVLSRVLGFVRTAVFNAEFGGNSPDLAAFWYAFRIPDTLFQLVAAGAIGSALVPVASELIAKGAEERARRVVATIANLMVAALVPLAAVLWLLAPLLVAFFIDPGGSAKHQALTTDLTRWLLLSPVFLAVGAVMAAALQALGIFGPPSIAPNVYNVAIIVAAIALTPAFGVYALVIGVVAGAAGHVLTQLPSVARHRLYRPALDLHDPAVRETFRLMAPRALGLGVTQLVFIVYAAFISLKADNSIIIWTTAFTTLQIPVGLVGVPLGIVLLPPLSQALAVGDQARFRRLVDGSLRLLLYIVLPMTGLMLALAGPGNALLWRHGEYTAADVAFTTSVFVVFLFGLVAHVLIALLAPIFYAGKDTRTPVMAALLAVVVDIAAGIALFGAGGLQGLALAIGLGAWAEVTMLLYLLERRVGFDLRPLARSTLAFLPGAALASLAAWAADRAAEAALRGWASFGALVVELAIAGLAGAAVYLGWSKLLRLEELDSTTELALGLLRRRTG